MNERSMCWAQLQPRHCRWQRLWRAQHRRRAKSYDENLVDMAQLKSIRTLLSLLKRHKPSPPADPQFFQWAERVVRAHQKNGDALELVKVVSELVPFLPENQRKTLAQLVMTETKSEATTSSTPMQSEPKRFLDIDVGHARGHGHSSKAPLILSRSEMPTRSTPQRSGGRLWGMLAASPAEAAVLRAVKEPATETSAVESSALEMEAEVEDMCLKTAPQSMMLHCCYRCRGMLHDLEWSCKITSIREIVMAVWQDDCPCQVFSTVSMNYTSGVTVAGESSSHCWIKTRNLRGVLSCSPWLAAVLFIGRFLLKLMQQNLPRFHVSKSHGLFKSQERSSVSHAAVEDFHPSHLWIFDSRDLRFRGVAGNAAQRPATGGGLQTKIPCTRYCMTMCKYEVSELSNHKSLYYIHSQKAPYIPVCLKALESRLQDQEREAAWNLGLRDLRCKKNANLESSWVCHYTRTRIKGFVRLLFQHVPTIRRPNSQISQTHSKCIQLNAESNLTITWSCGWPGIELCPLMQGQQAAGSVRFPNLKDCGNETIEKVHPVYTCSWLELVLEFPVQESRLIWNYCFCDCLVGRGSTMPPTKVLEQTADVPELL